MHECLLCERDMKRSKTIFGNGCIKNIYSLLELSSPKRIKNREDYLYKTKSIFSSTLYNLAYYSMKLKVMKEYDIDIQFELNDFEVMQ